MLTLSAGMVVAQTPMDEESPWPRVRATNGSTITIYQPQVETWTKNSFSGRRWTPTLKFPIQLI